MLAGAIGNLSDDLFRAAPPGRPFGLVRDFIDIYVPGRDCHFQTFTVADACISVGAVAFLLHGFFARGAERASERVEAHA